MMTALGLVEGAAALAVVAGADGLDAAQAILHLPFIEHADSCGVFEAGHDLVEVGEGAFRTTTARIAGHQQCRLVIQDVRAHMVEVAVEALPEVVAHDAVQRAAHIGRVDEVAKTVDVRLKLTDQLIDEAARAQLKYRLGRVRRAHVTRQHVSHGQPVVCRADFVFVVLAIEEVCIQPGAALREEGSALVGEFCFAEVTRHLFAGA